MNDNEIEAEIEVEPGYEMHEGEEEAPTGVRIASTLRWLLLAVAIVAALGTVSMSMGWIGSHASAASQYHCPMHPTVVSDREGDCPICGMDLVPITEGGDPMAVDHHHHGDEEDEILAVAQELGAEPGQWVCPMAQCGVVVDEPGSCPVCGMSLVQVPDGEAKVKLAEGPALYTCPMHPEVEQEGPGKCPICGMYLERKTGDPEALHEGHEHVAAPASHGTSKKGVPGLTSVVIPSERLAKIGVKTAAVEYGTLKGEVRTVGVVTADERTRTVVQARFSGWVEELLVAETGAKVKAGQPLVRVYSPELYQAQLDYLNALKWGGQMRNSAARRLELLGISKGDIARLAQSGRAQQTLALRAKSDGHVLSKEVEVGSYITPGDILYEVADLSKVWVLADVYEQDIPRVATGAGATFASSVRSGERFVGEVTFLYPTVEPATRTMKVRLEIPNEDNLLRPGMFGDVRLEVPGFAGSIVPRDAVIDAGEHVYALVARGGGRFSPREVHILSKGGDHLLVEGLDPGEEVVTSAGFFIDSESRLRAALAGMDGAAPAAHAHHDHGEQP